VGRRSYNAFGDGFNGKGDRHSQGILILTRGLEGGELARQQARRHIFVHAGGDPRTDQLRGAFEIDEEDRFAGLADEVLAIGALERRARADGHAFLRRGLMQGMGQRSEPGPTVLVRQRNAGPHLLLVGLRMKIVAVEKRRVEPSRDGLAGHRFAARGDAHDDQDAG